MKICNVKDLGDFAPEWLKEGVLLPEYTLSWQYGDEAYTGRVKLSEYSPVSGWCDQHDTRTIL